MVATGRWLAILEFAEMAGIAPSTVRALIREGVLDAEQVATPNGPRYLIWAQDAPAPTPPPAPMETVELPPFAERGGRRSFETRMKMGAGRLDIPVEEYRRHIEAGERWCTTCKRWQPAGEFGSDRSSTGQIARACRASRRRGGRYPACREPERSRHGPAVQTQG